ncbi:MAG TPA: DUF4405 domain-containing protein [Candidatus Limiplasma sp.]|nr:DUF4405 domain-containing protein [Candidatus Limiplasma sp.]HRX07724.1 DUF4405 domain-containing protein [Candidatus Limiplasma sp.]
MKMMNRVKLALDILLLLLLVLMYKKDVLGLSFHEIGGIALCALFIVHQLINIQWIVATSGRLFSKNTSRRLKLNWLIDFLQLVCFAYILVSGILVSKVAFPSGVRGETLLKTGHYAASALALVLVGAHIGLHYKWIVRRTPAHRLPLWFRRSAAILVSAVILGFGVYQMTATRFTAWMGNLGATIGLSGTLLDGGHDGETPVDGSESTLSDGGHGSGPRGGQGKGNGNGRGAAADLDVHTEYLADVLLGFSSITLAFAAAVAWLDGILIARKRKRLFQCDLPA